MSRPARATVDYFPHFVKGGKTLFILDSDFGNDGYAFWFKLLEILGSTEGMAFDCNKSANLRFLLSKTKIDEDRCLRIIETLVDLEAIDRELWEQCRVIWVQNLIENVKDAFKKRVADTPVKPEIEGFYHRKLSENGVSTTGNSENSTSDVVSTGINGESKVYQSRVDQNKSKEIRSNKKLYINLPIDDHIFLKIYNDCFFERFSKPHVKVNEEQLQRIVDMIKRLENQEIGEDAFKEGVEHHFNQLPEKNNGNILAFIEATPRIYGIRES